MSISSMALVREPAVQQAAELMRDFAERTGLTSERPPQRYLWTDAFAVCNYLALARATGQTRYTELGLSLVDQVHHVLGRHRSDDARSGWISGLGKGEGESHPTWGGLRIGKKLPERAVGEPFDEYLEWERDGQYFHYLTKWMHALDCVARATGQARFNVWARELAGVAHDAFVYGPPEARRMVWKTSIDLSRPLVSTMGHHDPLDGFVTSMGLRATASLLKDGAEGPGLEETAADFASMLEDRNWATVDPLGLGGLLTDACRVASLMRQGLITEGALVESLLSAALTGLAHYARQGEVDQPASRRLAFRELGLAIGLSALEPLEAELRRTPRISQPSIRARLEGLWAYAPLGTTIESFWREPAHQRVDTWVEHLDINEVMLATCLLPEGFLLSSDVAASSAA